MQIGRVANGAAGEAASGVLATRISIPALPLKVPKIETLSIPYLDDVAALAMVRLFQIRNWI